MIVFREHSISNLVVGIRNPDRCDIDEVPIKSLETNADFSVHCVATLSVHGDLSLMGNNPSVFLLTRGGLDDLIGGDDWGPAFATKRNFKNWKPGNVNFRNLREQL